MTWSSVIRLLSGSQDGMSFVEGTDAAHLHG
jgi:hypothetical protein